MKKKYVYILIALIVMYIAYILWKNIVVIEEIGPGGAQALGFNKTFYYQGGGVDLFLNGNLLLPLFYGGDNEIEIQEVKVFNRDSGDCQIKDFKVKDIPTPLSDVEPVNTPFTMRTGFFWIEATHCAPKNPNIDKPYQLNVNIRYKEKIGNQTIEKTSEGIVKFMYLTFQPS
jgi:hypothetical protein